MWISRFKQPKFLSINIKEGNTNVIIIIYSIHLSHLPLSTGITVQAYAHNNCYITRKIMHWYLSVCSSLTISSIIDASGIGTQVTGIQESPKGPGLLT